MPNLRKDTLAGVGWMGLAQLAGQAMRFIYAALLARLVAPGEFGLFQMALVFTGFAALLCDVGLGAALIQRPTVEQRQLSATFWFNLGMSLILVLLLCGLAEVLSLAYHKPAVAPLIRVVALDFLVGSLAIVHRALLVRALDFRRLALAETIGVLLGGLTALVAAFLGAGVWSLVTLVLTTTAVTTTLLWILKPWHPSLMFGGMVSDGLLSFGLHLQAFNMLNYWLRNLDKFLIGRLWGSASLGQYTRAYSTMLLPQSQLTGMLERVMWPALARCSGDLPRLREAYLQTLRLVCFVSFPFLAGLLVTADDFVQIVYGPLWTDCVPMLKWLCVVGMAQTPVATTGWLYLATGRTRLLLAWGVGAGALIATSLVTSALLGDVMTMIKGYTAATVFLVIPAFVVANLCVKLPWRAIVTAIGGPLLASAGMAGALQATINSPLAAFPPFERLAASVFAGAILYLGLSLLLRLPALQEARSLALEIRAKRLSRATRPAQPS